MGRKILCARPMRGISCVRAADVERPGGLEMDRQIEILTSGERVELNAFAERIVLSTLLGLLGSLHGVDTEREIRITIGAAKK